MTGYQRYFTETNIPAEGIDTISFWVNPQIISMYGAFHEYGNVHDAVNLRRNLQKDRSGKTIRANYIIDIQSEVLDPQHDILEQVLTILAQLVYDGVLNIVQLVNDNMIIPFLRQSFSKYFALKRLDFYFDLKYDDVVKRGAEDIQYPNTRYSSKNNASMKVYDRKNRQIEKNHLPHSQIAEIENPMRIEFHLDRRNCQYLHYDNLSGTYDDVFSCYLPFLAKRWRMYHSRIVDIPNRKNLTYCPHLRRVIELALQTRIPQYEDLLPTPVKPTLFKKS